MITRETIVQHARELIGTPFRHQARLPGVAIDCLNVVGETGLRAGIPNSEDWLRDDALRVYGKTPRPDVLLAKCDEYLDRVTRIGLGDILLFAFEFNPQHFGIVSCVSPMRMIHAYPTNGVGKVVETGTDIANLKFIRAYRFRGVEA